MVSLRRIQSAQKCIRKILPVTPLTYAANLSEHFRRSVHLKWDNKLKTGSFKERGVCYFLSTLTRNEIKRGVCAASAGNHALALSYHAARKKIPCTIVMPQNAPVVKAQATEAYGARLILHGSTFKEAYQHALTLAKESKAVFVPPFNDPRIISGQGVAGLEVLSQLDQLDAIIVPVGGGGYISGIATAVKSLRPKISIIGVRTRWAETRKRSKALPVLAPRTLADGVAVKTIGEHCAPLIEKFVDDLLVIDEETIAEAVTMLLEQERVVVEGSGALSIGVLIAKLLPPRVKRIVGMISGGNIDMNVLSRLIERQLARCDRLVKLRISVPDRPGTLHVISRNLARNQVNILEVFHDRSFSRVPGNVDLTLLLEVRDQKRRRTAIRELTRLGTKVEVI